MSGEINYCKLILENNKKDSDIHISRILKAVGNKEKNIYQMFMDIKSNKEVEKLMWTYYFPKSVEQIDRVKFEYDPAQEMSIYYLLEWGKNLISYFADTLNKYIKLKSEYESALFSENYIVAEKILKKIEKEFGISLWIYYQKFVVLSFLDNNTLKKAVDIVRKDIVKNDFIYVVLVYYEKMVDKKIDLEDYIQSIEKMSKKEGISVRGRFLNYKLGISSQKSIQDFKSALIMDEQISLIDYYESFVDIVQNLYAIPRMNYVVKEICDVLSNDINDYRIRNIFIALGGKIKENSIDYNTNKIIEEYTMGNYIKVQSEYFKWCKNRKIDFDVYNLFLKANINVANLGSPHKELWKDIYNIYNMQYEASNSIKRIGYYYKLMYNTSWRYKLLGILVRKLNYIEYDNILSLCILNDKILTPLFFQCILTDKDKFIYLEKFKEIAYNTISLHKYVLTGRINTEVINEVAPIRFKYYSIKRKIQEKNYMNAVYLCEDLLKNEERMYYQERIRRILFELLISKKSWIEAMHLYVESYLMKEEMVLRMPLNDLVSNISRILWQDDSVRYDICTPIIFRLFYGQDDKEVISSYLDYLENQKCSTIIQFIEQKSYLTRQEAFFLYGVCTETLLLRDYVSSSFLSNKNAVDLRIYILKALVRLDPAQEKKYVDELNKLFKEVQLQERMKSFNHNRIYIDRIKLLEYLCRTINKEFSNYAKVRELKSLYSIEDDESIGELIVYENMYQFFYDIIEKIKQAYLFDSPYSLEDFLSARVRHVYCEVCLKKSLEEQTLFSKKLTDASNEYTVNDYWKNKLPEKDFEIVIRLLAKFSKKIDNKVQDIRDVWMRIKKSENGEEYFNYYDFSETFMKSAELDLDKVLDSEEQFYKSVISQLDIWTNRILTSIRERIDRELISFYSNALLELEAEINKSYIAEIYRNELLRKVETCKVKCVEDINNFKDVLYMKSEQYPDFALEEVVNFCCKIESDINSRFNNVKVDIKNECDLIYSGSIFSYMVDIISILIHNAVEHSQIQDLSLLNIQVGIYSIDKYYEEILNDKQDFSVVLTIRNNLAETVDVNLLYSHIDNIMKDMHENIFREKSKLVKGSGMYKIARTVYYSLDDICTFFYVYEKNWFNINIAMGLKKFLKGK